MVRFFTMQCALVVAVLFGCQSETSLPTPKPSDPEEIDPPTGSPEKKPGETDALPPVPTEPTYGALIGTVEEQGKVKNCIQTGFFYRRTSTATDPYAQAANIGENPGCSKVEKIAPFPCTEESLLVNPEIKASVRTPPVTDSGGLRFLFQEFKAKGFLIDQCSLFPYKYGNTDFKFRVYFVKEDKTTGTTVITVDSVRIPK